MYMVKNSTTTRFKNHRSKSVYYVDKGKPIIDTLFFFYYLARISGIPTPVREGQERGTKKIFIWVHTLHSTTF